MSLDLLNAVSESVESRIARFLALDDELYCTACGGRWIEGQVCVLLTADPPRYAHEICPTNDDQSPEDLANVARRVAALLSSSDGERVFDESSTPGTPYPLTTQGTS